MKTKKRLEEKITEAEEFLPGVGEMLKSISKKKGARYHNEHPTDVEYLEIHGHKVVAAKWEARYWHEFKGGVGTDEWAVVYLLAEDEIEEKVLSGTMTRDQFSSSFDRRDWLYHDFISLEALGDDKAEVAWVKHDGKKGPTYVVELK
jgi:hypothetical protein